ncbi:MAG: toprim domain-containing protein, partial [Bacteroidales bacterium]|nr:toprim domain-containing protein [Bacteroidales bacterium]
MISDKDINILNSIPLTDVMLAWGYVPATESTRGSWAGYVCPWHDDHRPSLVVDKAPRKGATDLGFKCMAGHCGQQGFGAIQLAARLMGFPAGQLSKEDYLTVLTELAERLHVETEDGIPGSDVLRKKDLSPKKFSEQEPRYAEWDGSQPIFEQGTWTLQGLRALGLKVDLATRRLRQYDLAEYADSPEVPAVRVGDMKTQYDPDTGEPLYRCSIGRGFYGDPKKAETRTVAEWGRELEQRFHVFPVARFIQKCENKEKGGWYVRIVNSTPSYPIFMFKYGWGIKKYEPLTRYSGNKWTWWCLSDDADLEHRFYGDSDLEDLLEGVASVPDDRHPLLEVKTEKNGAVTKKKCFERVVICSGPRDAIAVWSHSNAHVVWLHSEAAGFDHKGTGAVRPNRWLRAFIRKLRDVTADGGLYVCYDEDATGIAASQAIALSDPKIRWLRLPRELSQIQNSRF